jgi:hypothetical protein
MATVLPLLRLMADQYGDLFRVSEITPRPLKGAKRLKMARPLYNPVNSNEE